MTRVLLAILLALTIGHAYALESSLVVSKRVTATLVSESDSVAAGQPIRIGLRLRLADGWHTYWRNPGDAGAPPELTLELPPGATAGPIDWPTPHRLREGALMTYAYTGDVLLPVTVTTAAAGLSLRDHAQSFSLRAHAEWLVCKDICVPEEGDFVLDLAPGAASPSAQSPLFARHDQSVPRPSPWQSTISADGTLTILGPGLGLASVADAWFIPAEPGKIQDDAAQPLSVRSGGFSLALAAAKGFDPASGLTGIVSVRDRSGQQTDVAIGAERVDSPTPVTTALPVTLLFAFLGGLILNLMPCVFPVLAMKAVGLARGIGSGSLRWYAVSYTAGILVAFGALGVALLVARATGSASGWGFQFQSPIFVAAMTWVLFGAGLNLSGVFQIGGRLTSAGGHLATKEGHAGSFFTGLLAVLVATPCTAPFMGAAIAAGLAAPSAVTILVFLTMGLGLAAPYVALACLPGVARFAPRPGRWMEVLKQALAFPMYGAAVWLLWVIGQEAGPTGVLLTAAGCVLLGFAAWAFGLAQYAAGTARAAGRAVAVAALAGVVWLLTMIEPVPPAPETGASEAFSPARLAALRAEHRPVFINMTASWCVTCLVNERVVLSSPAVRQAFELGQIVYLKGDWTRQDLAITAFLRENGRDGVPLYVFYPPNGAAPTQLPQILSEAAVLAALKRR